MKEKEIKGRKALLAIAVAVAVAMTGCGERPREVNRTVELHYVNGEVETRIFRGDAGREPYLTDARIPDYYDGYNRVRCVVRFRVLRVDTLEQKGGAK